MAAANTIPEVAPSGPKTSGPASVTRKELLRSERATDSGRSPAYSDNTAFSYDASRAPGVASVTVAKLVSLSPLVSVEISSAPKAPPRKRSNRRKIGLK